MASVQKDTERQTDRHPEKERDDNHIGREIFRHTDMQTNKQADRNMEKTDLCIYLADGQID